MNLIRLANIAAQILHPSRRQLASTTFSSPTPVSIKDTFPTDNWSPGTVTIPAVNPTPPNSPTPVTNPVTTPSKNSPGGQQPTNPSPTGGFPITVPAVAPPVASSGAPAASGQSWCVAKNGVPDTNLQTALDYACGIAGNDCSAIQQGASCYNPNTLQNHASYAFNSYYQKNPAQTSCDFGGIAVITNVNPSTGSCIFSTMSSSTQPPATTTNPTTTPPSTGATPTSSGTPTISNASSPDTGGFPTTSFPGGPPIGNNIPASISSSLQPFIWCITVVTSIISWKTV